MCDERNTNESTNLGPRSYVLRMTGAEWPGGRLALRGPSTPRGFQYPSGDGWGIDPREDSDVIRAHHAVMSLGSRPW